MDHPFKTYGEALTLLAELPNAESTTPIDLETIFEANIKNASEKLSIKDMTRLSSLKCFGVNVGCDDVRWKWVALAVHILLKMKECDEGGLLNIRQEKAIRTTLEFIVSLGLLPSLLPGVGVPIAKRCSSATAEWVLRGSSLEEKNQIPVLELHKRLTAVTRVLLSCIKNEHLRGPILSRHLCDLLAALCQLSAAPLKKPKTGDEKAVIDVAQFNPSSPHACRSAEDERIFSKKKEDIEQRVLVSEINEANALSMDCISKTTEFQMTAELWDQLQLERNAFSRDLENLVTEIHQPLVIRDLLLLQGSPEKPGGIGVKMAPLWLRRACASLLNSCLFRKGGVVATVHAICDAFSLPRHSRTDAWAQHIALGRVIAMAVHARKGDAEWFEGVCSQVVDLLSPKNVKDDTDYARAGVVCMSLLLEAKKEMCMKFILEPMMAPLAATSPNPCPPASNEESVAEGCSSGTHTSPLEDCGKTSDSLSLIESSLSVIDFCFVENDPRVSLPTNILSPLFTPLLREYRDKRLGGRCLSLVSRILLKFINNCSEESILSECFKSVLFEGSFDDLKSMAERAESPEILNTLSDLELSEEKFLKVLVNKHFNADKLGKAVEEIGETNELGWGSGPLLELVSTDASGACILFRYVLQAFPKGGDDEESCMASIAKQSVATQLLCHLLEVPSVNELVRKDPRDVVNFLGDFLSKEAYKVFNPGSVTDSSLLNASGEGVFPSVLDLGLNPTDSKACMEEKDTFDKQGHSEFVLVALLILKSICEVSRVENNDQEWWSPFRKILPQVRAFRRNSSCSEVRAMAEDVACAILTRGNDVVGGVETGASRVISGGEEIDTNSRNEGEGSAFEKALKMAQEDEVSLRGHALIALKRLLSSKDQVAMRNQMTLLQVFQENLKHTDSYVYLAAIDGLEKLGLVLPDQVLESLADEYAEIGVVQMGNADFNGARLKVGEALLRVTRTLGDMAPKFNCLLLNAFLGGVRDADSMVRASSLSNLGEICKILSFRLGPIATEVLWCVRCVLETDCAVEARRAAVLVLHLLLQGLGVQMFKILETALPDLYRTLKSVRSNDCDEVVKLHAQLALEEVDRITLEFLFPPQRLEKKIFVLDPPS